MAQWTEMSPWLGKSARYEIQQLLLKSGIYCTANMWNRTVTPWQYEARKKKVLVISNDVGNSGLSVVCGGYIVVDLDVVDSKPHGKWHRVTVRWHNHMEQLLGIVTWGRGGVERRKGGEGARTSYAWHAACGLNCHAPFAEYFTSPFVPLWNAPFIFLCKGLCSRPQTAGAFKASISKTFPPVYVWIFHQIRLYATKWI